MDFEHIVTFSQHIRLKTLEMIFCSSSSHIGSCFSCTDILATLYYGWLRVNPLFPLDPLRDWLIVSKGHAAAAVYATLGLKGFFPLSWLDTYGTSTSKLLGHVSHHVPGVEYSSGSLGQGLSIGCGIALGLRAEQKMSRVVVLASDGELNEGSFWEGAMFAAHHQLNSLCVVVDLNGIQSLGLCKQILSMGSLKQKFEAFGFKTIEVDGHDVEKLYKAFDIQSSKPKVILANTIKGKGVSFMENNLLWHYKNPSMEQFLEAKQELKCAHNLSTIF
jgi:transketolase